MTVTTSSLLAGGLNKRSAEGEKKVIPESRKMIPALFGWIIKRMKQQLLENNNGKWPENSDKLN
jgi:hypothetical protein